MDDISRERRSGSLPEQGGTIREHGPHERSTTGETIVDESALARGVEPVVDTVEVPRVIVEPDPRSDPEGPPPDPSADAGEGEQDASPDLAPVDDAVEEPQLDEEPQTDIELEKPEEAETDSGAGVAAMAADDEDEAPALSDPAEIARVSLGLLLTQRDGVSPMRLAEVCGTTQKNVRAGLDRLVSMLEHDGLPLVVQRSGDKVKLLTRPEIYPYVQRLKGIKRKTQLSPAALETLAVIAYRQPVIRAEIESIRGVKAGPMLRSLLEGKLVKVVGRADVPGRPLQYGTTQEFLERFGLASLKELPSVQEFKAL